MEKQWHKGVFGFFAPIWVRDPEGECMVVPRHVGHILLPLAEFLVQSVNLVCSALDAYYQPHFPIQYWPEKHRGPSVPLP